MGVAYMDGWIDQGIQENKTFYFLPTSTKM